MNGKEKVYPVEKLGYGLRWLFSLPIAVVFWLCVNAFTPAFGSSSPLLMLRAAFSDTVFCLAFVPLVSSLLGVKFSDMVGTRFGRRFFIPLLAMLGAALLSELVLGLIFPGRYEFSLETGASLWSFPASLVLVLCAALFEELAFRQWFLLLKFKSDSAFKQIGVCLVSATLFTLFHFGNPEMSVQFLVSSLYYFIMGFVLMLLAFRSGSIAVPLGIHVANNLVSAWFVGYGDSVITTNTLFRKTGPLSYVEIVQLCVCLVAVCLLIRPIWSNTVEEAVENGK